MFNLTGKQAIVTGGGSGIGKAISEKLAEAGAVVQVLDTNESEGKRTAHEIKASGNLSYFHACDVSDPVAVQETIDRVAQQANIHILINNAAIAHVGNIENTTGEDMMKLYQVNVLGVFNCSKAVIPYFKRASGGVIINMASIASTMGLSDRFAYTMTKGATLSMTYSLAKDYLADGIRCNAISPARIHTPFVDGYLEEHYRENQKEMFETLSKYQPIGRMGTPAEVAALVLFLCSDEAAFITGCNYPIDGGCLNLMG